jgi:hypothetical protein
MIVGSARIAEGDAHQVGEQGGRQRNSDGVARAEEDS